MRFVNLTPHKVNILNESGEEVVTIEPTGLTGRATTKRNKVGDMDGVPVFETEFGDPVIVSGDGAEHPPTYAINPSGDPDTIYVGSRLFKQALGAGYDDVLCPGELKRDSDGQPIGCIGLSK